MGQNLMLVNKEDLKEVLAEIMLESELVITGETWSTKQVAEFLQTSVPTVISEASKGVIPGVLLGSTWKFNSRKIMAFRDGVVDE